MHRIPICKYPRSKVDQLVNNQQLRSLAQKSSGSIYYPRPLKTKKYGIDILHDPLWNKSLAFGMSERDRLGLRGLIPPTTRTFESQIQRTIARLRRQPDAISKNVYLQDLHNRNETLFHRVLIEYIEEVAPLVYTPTVGLVCQQFGLTFSRARGMYFSIEDRGQFSSMVYNWPHDDVHIIVVTDGSRVLGLGDLGVHGMGIPIGKLALYCAAGGITPHRVLPITLDVGTNNQKLLNDPDYVGLRVPRLQGDEYFDFVDEFMQAVFGRWPHVVVQFEDFETTKAVPLLKKYRNKYRCFNDDIQGTGSVTLAGVLSAARIANIPFTEMKFLCAGAGAAGQGVCSHLMAGLIAAGLSPEEARSRFVLCTINGALGKLDSLRGNKNQIGGTYNEEWANHAISDGATLHEAMESFKPTVLLGLSTTPGLFDQRLISEMLKHTARPIILPMSNPTSKAECTPQQAYEWTDGKALVATGSPFPPVTLADGRVLTPSQCNNMYIFPGLGLAASVAGISHITDNMLYQAALACSRCLTPEDIAAARTFPPVQRIREVSQAVACAVIEEGLKHRLTTTITARHLEEGIPNLVARKMYFPTYVPLL